MPKLCQKEDLVGTESIHQSIYRPGTGQEINRKGTCIKFASNVYDYKMPHLCTLCVPNTMDNTYSLSFFPSMYILLQRICQTYRTTHMLELFTTQLLPFLSFFFFDKKHDNFVSVQSGMLLALIRLPRQGMYLVPIRLPHQGMYLVPIRLPRQGMYLVPIRLPHFRFLNFFSQMMSWGLYTKNDINQKFWVHLQSVMVCGLRENLFD